MTPRITPDVSREARFFLAVRKTWAIVVRYGHVVNVCRWSVLGVLIGLLLFTDPGLDLYRGLDRPHDKRWWWVLLAGVLWATNVWYWARTMLSLQMPRPPQAQTHLIQGFATWLPRVLGTVGLAMLAVQIRLAAGPTEGEPREVLMRWSAVMGGAAVVFLVAVILRRKLAGGRGHPMPATPPVDEHADLTQLRPGSKRFLLALSAVAVGLLALFWTTPRVAPHLGTITIVLFAASLWVPIGSAVTYFALRERLPLVSALVIWAIAISPCTDNRALDTRPRPGPDPRPGLAAFLDTRHQALTAGGQRLVYLVAAEGGGIRAAYWTASLLGRLADKDERFLPRLLAVSSVSGGSLGAAVFTALAADGRDHARQVADRAPRSSLGDCVPADSPFRCAGRSILSEDYLATDVASLLFPDLLQRMLPVALPRTDRARAFEASWRAGWRRRAGNDRFGEPFEDLWPGGVSASAVPALFLNSTLVETGARLIWSPVNLAPSPPHTGAGGDAWSFPDATDGLVALESPAEPPGSGPSPAEGAGAKQRHTVSLATAAHASARFPYVSPAGRLPRGHVVDGGYFENSGAATALDLLAALDRFTDLDVVVVVIGDAVEDTPPPRDLMANDLLAPPRTLFRTRDGRARYAVASLERAVARRQGCLVRMRRLTRQLEPPLSWVLSHSAQKELDAQLLALEPRLEAVLAPLRGARFSCPP
jgi:hypothetical protein